jgi:hypothetical protein
MRSWMNLAAALVLYGIGVHEVGFAQGSRGTESKFLTIGDVSKIDAKTKSITISEATSYNIAQLGNAGGTSGAPGGGRAGGGGAVRGGGGGRGSGGGRGGGRGAGGSAQSTGRLASAPIPMEYKVTVSSKTVIKEDDNDLRIEDLKVGDRLQVFSMKGGSKLDASEIIRTSKSSP